MRTAVLQTVNEDGVAQTISGTGKSRIVDVALRDASGREVEVVGVGAELTLEIQVEVLALQHSCCRLSDQGPPWTGSFWDQFTSP